jgi:predicted membrane GTPase involved in stress response
MRYTPTLKQAVAATASTPAVVVQALVTSTTAKPGKATRLKVALIPAKGKQLTNIRAAGSDDSVILTTPTVMSLEDCINYINDDELVELTPAAIRLRKRRVK